MTLSDFANLSTAISGFAVVASLIYLGFQFRQNAKHTRAMIRQARASRTVEVQLALADADMAAALILANGEEPTADAIKARQFRSLFTAQYYSHEDSFSQHELGLLDEDALAMTRASIVRVFGQPGYRKMWENFKSPGTKFAAFVDDKRRS